MPWWRIVLADGTPAPVGRGEATAQLRAEGVPMTGDRVDLGRARWDGLTAPPLGGLRPTRPGAFDHVG